MKSEDSTNPMQETSSYMAELIERKHLPVSIKKLEKPGRKNSLQFLQDEVQDLNFKLSSKRHFHANSSLCYLDPDYLRLRLFIHCSPN